MSGYLAKCAGAPLLCTCVYLHLSVYTNIKGCSNSHVYAWPHEKVGKRAAVFVWERGKRSLFWNTMSLGGGDVHTSMFTRPHYRDI